MQYRTLYETTGLMTYTISVCKPTSVIMKKINFSGLYIFFSAKKHLFFSGKMTPEKI